jgi:hypothetical protein
MATTTTAVTSAAYVSVNAAGVDGIIQNTGNVDVLLIFSVAQPAVGASNYHVLKANGNQAMQVVLGVPGNEAWARAYSDNLVGSVSVSN